MVNIVDSAAPLLRQGFRMFARSSTYTPTGGTGQAIMAFVRGVRAEDLFGSAMQHDVAAVVDVEEFRAAFGADAVPAKYDRLRAMSKNYAVEEWRGAPNDDAPVFFRILLRGGSQ
jgi:hypothetical protein